MIIKTNFLILGLLLLIPINAIASTSGLPGDWTWIFLFLLGIFIFLFVIHIIKKAKRDRTYLVKQLLWLIFSIFYLAVTIIMSR